MKNASYLSSLGHSSLAARLLIQVIVQNSDIDAEVQPISALTVEKSGREWYLWIRGGRPGYSMKCIKLPAKSTMIGGKSLGHYLEGTEAKGI